MQINQKVLITASAVLAMAVDRATAQLGPARPVGPTVPMNKFMENAIDPLPIPYVRPKPVPEEPVGAQRSLVETSAYLKSGTSKGAKKLNKTLGGPIGKLDDVATSLEDSTEQNQAPLVTTGRVMMVLGIGAAGTSRVVCLATGLYVIVCHLGVAAATSAATHIYDKAMFDAGLSGFSWRQLSVVSITNEGPSSVPIEEPGCEIRTKSRDPEALIEEMSVIGSIGKEREYDCGKSEIQKIDERSASGTIFCTQVLRNGFGDGPDRDLRAAEGIVLGKLSLRVNVKVSYGKNDNLFVTEETLTRNTISPATSSSKSIYTYELCH